MRIAMIGCGYVADYYMRTLPNYPQIELAGVTDRNPERLSRFGEHYSIRIYNNVQEILHDPSIEAVVNLTNPSSHYEVSKSCLEAGKNVYSEKPLAMAINQAQELVEIAERQHLYLASAPCSILGESAQTVWKALRQEQIGRVRLVYAELDDGMTHRSRYRKWRSESGAPWPYKDEFEVGCTLEHAGYYLTWLTAFFGPAKSVTSFASCLIPDKQTDVPLERESPDFSVACIEFQSGVVARLTCSIVAPTDRSLRIIGDDGLLWIRDCWRYGSPVYILKRTPLTIRAGKYARLTRLLLSKRLPRVKAPTFRSRYGRDTTMDFARGIAELIDAATERRPCRISARCVLHVNEIALAIQNPQDLGVPRAITSAFEPMDPMPWAKP